jgi:hypothetical protein
MTGTPTIKPASSDLLWVGVPVMSNQPRVVDRGLESLSCQTSLEWLIVGWSWFDMTGTPTHDQPLEAGLT